MSSHHVIREKQEPALIVHDVTHTNEEILAQLLEWSPILITNDSCASSLASSGIKIDVIISNSDTWDTQSHVTFIQGAQKSFLELSMNYLLSKGYPAVNIIGTCIPLARLTRYWEQINIVVLQQGVKLFSVKSGFSKWKPASELIQIYGKEGTLQTKNLERLDKGIYRTIADGFYELTFTDSPYIIVAETL